MGQLPPCSIFATCLVTHPLGVISSYNVASVVRTGIGLYTITLGSDIGFGEVGFDAWCDLGHIKVVGVPAPDKWNITVNDCTGVNTDLAFGVSWFRISPNLGLAPYDPGPVIPIVNSGARLTAEGGLATYMINATGAPSVKGTLIEASSAVDHGFILCGVGDDDPVGIVYDGGIADGQPCLVVVSGFAECLIEAGSTIQRRYWGRTPTATPGRVDLSNVIGGGSVAEHFKECAHCFETKANTGDTLALCAVHFN